MFLLPDIAYGGTINGQNRHYEISNGVGDVLSELTAYQAPDSTLHIPAFPLHYVGDFSLTLKYYVDVDVVADDADTSLDGTVNASLERIHIVEISYLINIIVCNVVSFDSFVNQLTWPTLTD